MGASSRALCIYHGGCDDGFGEVESGKFQYSLRSRGDFDVSAIAKKFGGGGHKNAAGFNVVGTVHATTATKLATFTEGGPLP